MKKILASLLLSLPMLALAHPGHESISVGEGIFAGVIHPLMGLDHLLAFAALGILLFRLTTKQALIIGTTFIALLAVGFYGAQAGVLNLASIMVEGLILMSVVLSIVCLGLGRFVGHYKSAFLVTTFAIFHGIAHGVEVPSGASSHGFAIGFLLSSAVLMVLTRLTACSVYSLRMKKQSI